MRHIKTYWKRIFALFALFSLEILFVWAIFLGSLFIFLFIAKEIFYSKQMEFDRKAFEYLDSYSTPFITEIMEGVTFFASRNFIFTSSLLIFIYFLFVKKHSWYSLKVPAVALGSITLNLILKNLFNRPRPLVPHLVDAYGLSFPSGHAMVSFSFYGLLIFLVWENVKNIQLKYSVMFFLLLFIHLIGLSRVYLHVHYASDVLAGFAIGSIWLIISIFILKKIEKYSREKVDPVIEEITVD